MMLHKFAMMMIFSDHDDDDGDDDDDDGGDDDDCLELWEDNRRVHFTMYIASLGLS